MLTERERKERFIYRSVTVLTLLVGAILLALLSKSSKDYLNDLRNTISEITVGQELRDSNGEVIGKVYSVDIASFKVACTTESDKDITCSMEVYNKDNKVGNVVQLNDDKFIVLVE